MITLPYGTSKINQANTENKAETESEVLPYLTNRWLPEGKGVKRYRLPVINYINQGNGTYNAGERVHNIVISLHGDRWWPYSSWSSFHNV